MPVPTSYTEAEFIAFLHSRLGAMADHLAWTENGGSYDEAVNDTLLALEETDITTITDIQGLRTVGQLMLWRAVADATVGEFNYSADGNTFNMEAVHQHAVERVADFEVDAMPYLSGSSYQVTSANVEVPDDPYVWESTEEWA